MMRKFKNLPVLFLLALLGCGGGGASDKYALCGNGHLDAGEQCDDGNIADNDGCLSTCVRATCGDGFIDLANEQCDGNNLKSCGTNHTNACTCNDLQLSAGTLRCAGDCSLDTSGCGPLFTATPLRSPSATTTPSPTATATPEGRCGNGVLEESETCTMCPADCEVAACTPGAPVKTVRIAVVAPQGVLLTAMGIVVGYRSSTVSLPSINLSSRIKKLVPAVLSSSDLDYAVRVNLSPFTPVSSAPLFTVDFDTCAGASSPSLSDFGCSIESCTKAGSVPVQGCTCAVSIP